MSVPVFIIVNEWTDLDNDVSSEVVGGTYFATMDDAHEALALIAESLDEEIGPLETSFVSESDPHLQFQEYYIQELARG